MKKAFNMRFFSIFKGQTKANKSSLKQIKITFLTGESPTIRIPSLILFAEDAPFTNQVVAMAALY